MTTTEHRSRMKENSIIIDFGCNKMTTKVSVKCEWGAYVWWSERWCRRMPIRWHLVEHFSITILFFVVVFEWHLKDLEQVRRMLTTNLWLGIEPQQSEMDHKMGSQLWCQLFLEVNSMLSYRSLLISFNQKLYLGRVRNSSPAFSRFKQFVS